MRHWLYMPKVPTHKMTNKQPTDCQRSRPNLLCSNSIRISAQSEKGNQEFSPVYKDNITSNMSDH